MGLLFGLGACGGDGDPQAAASSVPVVLADGTEVHGVHPVRCGCVIRGIGHCGNYVDVEGRPYEILGDVGLGKMEFCGEDGVEAAVDGTIEGGRFLATSVTVQE